MGSPKSLREWCRVTCTNYPNVEIRNMSTSFRDGLAFCAIIHKHRPDLIDFSSLSKDNVYLNNKLAFEIAERKLGIPALLDPKYMVSTKVPDYLSVITYISQYYFFFNGKSYGVLAGLASLRSSQVTFLNTKSKTPDRLKPLKSSTGLETSRDRLQHARPQTVCVLCFKPVHLIQRHLTDGKIYHRSCFRCKVCHFTLLPGWYKQGSDDSSFICTHHLRDSNSTRVVISTENRPKFKFQTGCVSLGGLAIPSIPHYTKTTESQDRLVCKTPETEGKGRQRENSDSTVGLKCNVNKPAAPRHPPPPSVKDGNVEGCFLAESEIQQQEVAKPPHQPPELSSPCAQVTEGSSQPVPAPRRMLDSSEVPAPAARTKTTQPMNSSPAARNSSNQRRFSSNSSHIWTSSRPKVHTNHPWLSIIHPGPWTQLSPAQSPIPNRHSKSVYNLQRLGFTTGVSPPNPFEEDLQVEGTKPEPADQTKPPVAEIHPGDGGHLTNKSGDAEAAVCPNNAKDTAIKSPPDDEGASSELAGEISRPGLSDLGETTNTGAAAASDEAQHHSLPRSLSVAAVTSDPCQSTCLPFDLTEEHENDQVTSCQHKLACKENPFDRKPAMSKSKSFQALPSFQTSAPGTGFPLVKRKVQTDQTLSTEDLQVEMCKLDKHLEALEQRGVELEANLRDCKNDKEEEQMLMDWFYLVHERHVLVCRGIELVHLRKQQEFEERQADVEYELRCVLNKPEGDWSQEDRDREQQLMEELVVIIEQRNQIISNLEMDRQREREEDTVLKAMTKDKDFQKEGLKELKRSKGKFNPTKMFKMLNRKAERKKESMDKKS